MNFQDGVETGMGSFNSALPQDRKLSASSTNRNSQNFGASRLFSSTSDNFSHDSYNAGHHRYSPGLSPSLKQSKLKSFLQALPSAKQLQTVKQKLVKRWSADSRPGAYSPPFGSDWLLTDLERTTDFCGSSVNVAVSHQRRGSGSTTAADKRSRTRYREHCKNFREFLSDWSLADLHRLTIEFDASRALSRLHRSCDVARPAVSTIADDLLMVLVDGTLADTVLRIDGSVNEHRMPGSLVAVRSLFVRDLLMTKQSQFFGSATVQNCEKTAYTLLNIKREELGGLDDECLRHYLSYLYPGRLETPERYDKSAFAVSGGTDTVSVIGWDDLHCKRILHQFLRRRNEQVGDLMADLKKLYEMTNVETCGECVMAPDAVLLFVNGSLLSTSLSDTNAMVEQQKHSSFKCHTPILTARSPFFRNLIEKRRCEASMVHLDGQSCSYSKSSPYPAQCRGNVTEIVLDESVIPRQYAPVILKAMYTDEVDLSLVIRGCMSSSSCLTEVQAIASGKCQISPIDEATEIYQIARFLEFGMLAQGCENIIAQHICMETLPAIYNWSNESHGSKFVRRHCVNFLCQEFVRIANTAILFDLEESLLIDVLKSDFLQASELEILTAILKWGEHQLVKRIEEREPNILSGTTHSISRKGVRRSDLSDEELQEVLENLTPLIRTDFMLPVQHVLFLNAQSRRLLTSTQSFANSVNNETTPKSDLRMTSSLNVDDVSVRHGDVTNFSKHQHPKLSRSAIRRPEPDHHQQPRAFDNKRHLSTTDAVDDGRQSPTNHWQALVSDKQATTSSLRQSPAICGRQAPQARHASVGQTPSSSHQPTSANNRQTTASNFAQPLPSVPSTLTNLDDGAATASLPPRLFAAYYETARRELEQRLAARPDQLSALINAVARPDYNMVTSPSTTMTSPSLSLAADVNVEQSTWWKSDDISDCPVPNALVMQDMRRSLDELLHSNLIRKAVACGCTYHRNATLQQARVKIVRDFGLSDSAAQFLADQPINSNRCTIDYRVSVDVFNCDQNENLSQSPVFGDGFSRNFEKTEDKATSSFLNLPPDSERHSFNEPQTVPVGMEKQYGSCQSDWPDLMTSSVAKPIDIPLRREPNEMDYALWSTDASNRLSALKVDSFLPDRSSSFATTSSYDRKSSNSYAFFEKSDDYV